MSRTGTEPKQGELSASGFALDASRRFDSFCRQRCVWRTFRKLIVPRKPIPSSAKLPQTIPHENRILPRHRRRNSGFPELRGTRPSSRPPSEPGQAARLCKSLSSGLLERPGGPEIGHEPLLPASQLAIRKTQRSCILPRLFPRLGRPRARHVRSGLNRVTPAA